MRYNAYFVRLETPQDVFQGSVQLDGQSLPASFRRLAGDLFMVQFTNQAEFTFRQRLELKNARGAFTVLLPVLSQYNQRKLRRMGEALSDIEGREFIQIVPALLAVDNFLDLEGLLHFFSLERSQAVEALTALELALRLKVINLNYLFVTSWEHYAASLEAMETVLRQAYEGRERTVKFARLEKAVGAPQESIFFRYLLRKCSQEFPCRVLPQALVFSQLPLSAEEKTRIAEIEKALRTNKLPLFTFENVQKNTPFTVKQINDALWAMLNEGTFLQLDERHFIFSDEYAKIINRLKKFARNQGDVLTFDDLRGLTGYSRKYLIVLFEYWDRQHITCRIGNRRKILLGS